VRTAALAAVVMGIVAGAPAQAQAPDSLAPSVQFQRVFPPGASPVRVQDFTLFARPPGGLDDSPGVSQRPIPALTREQMVRLRTAMSLRLAGQLDEAREALAPLSAEAPHHALIVTELARLLLASQDWAAAERLTRAERLGTRDSLVVGYERVVALQGLGRRREAADVALECLIAGPGSGSWVRSTIESLAAAEPAAVRESLRRALERRPQRTDVALLSARVEWILGDERAALKTLAAADRPGAAGSTPARWSFAEQVIRSGAPRDSGGAIEALTSLAGDAAFDPAYRLSAARRALDLSRGRGGDGGRAATLLRALKDVPVAHWNPEFAVALSRGLRGAGRGADARVLLESLAAGSSGSPALALEQALGELRDGPPERALVRLRVAADGSEEGAFRYAEALFFSGAADSALGWYQRISANSSGEFAGAALERIYLLEQTEPRAALPAFGRVAWEDWRGQPQRAQALADSLWRALGPGPLWAQAALQLAGLRERAGDPKGALIPLLAVADSLPGDRLAPLARQRAGDLYLTKLKDERQALAQYEECLARYPRAWNAAEVRRKVEQLRRERRF
jgi:tetratricopeptide (TPR) repeat protein